MPEKLEGPDELIGLRRASGIAGLNMVTLAQAAQEGRLRAIKPANEWLTTRRNLHRYLAHRRSGPRKPVPEGYLTPEGEEEIR